MNKEKVINKLISDTLYDVIKEEINQYIDVDDQKDIATKLVNDLISRYEVDASDGYHTFGELYKHRHHLFIALCSKIIDDMNNYTKVYSTVYQVSKSKEHHDGLDVWNEWGMFLIQLETREGQISYHIPNEYWETCSFIDTLEKANKFDGHTSNDVLKRLLLI